MERVRRGFRNEHEVRSFKRTAESVTAVVVEPAETQGGCAQKRINIL